MTVALALLLTVAPKPLAPDFDSIVVERVATGYQFTEGCVWTPAGTLVFSDIPANKIYEWKPGSEPTVLHEPSGNANGNLIGRNGKLVSCLHGARSVVSWSKKGKSVDLATKFEGKQLNSPNDVAYGPQKSLYFTDPPYGINPKDSAIGFAGVYRITGSGKVTLQEKGMNRPNGIAFSPDMKIAYVSDTANRNILKFSVDRKGDFYDGKEFAKLNYPDGMRVDSEGNVYCTANGGVHVFSPAGEKLGMIKVPENPTNCAFGEKDMKTLFITAQKSVYKCAVPIRGKA